MSRSFSLVTLSLFAAASSLLSGCASILGGGGNQGVNITSLPSGAQIEIRDSTGKTTQTATTPCRVTVDRGKGFFQAASYTIHATANGSERDVALNPGINPWYWGNILIGGLAGMLVVDPLTGAMWNLPENVNVDFDSPSVGPANPKSANNSQGGSPSQSPMVLDH